MTNLIEQIAAQWDGCMYEGVGGDIDIGQAIRDAGKDLAKEAGAAAAERECANAECGWRGFTDRMLGNIGPLCPKCSEITEVAALTSAPTVPEAIKENVWGDSLLPFIKGVQPGERSK